MSTLKNTRKIQNNYLMLNYKALEMEDKLIEDMK